MDPFLLLLVLEPLLPRPAFGKVEVLFLWVVGNEVLSVSYVKRDHKSLRDDGIKDLTVIRASFTDSDEGVDGDSAATVGVVGDGKEGADVVLVEMEIKAALIGVNVREVGEVSARKVVPIGGSDVGIDVVADLVSGEGWPSADRSAAAWRTDWRRADKSTRDGQVDEGQKERAANGFIPNKSFLY